MFKKFSKEWKKMLQDIEKINPNEETVKIRKYQEKKDNELIDSLEDLEFELENGDWISKEDSNIKPEYVDLYYQCKCDSVNILTETRYEFTSSSGKVKFLFSCYCGVLTAVRVKMKSLLTFETIDLWHCDISLLDKYLKDV